MPYLHWEHSIARYHVAKIVKDARHTLGQIEAPSLTAREVSALPCGVQEKLIRFNVPVRPHFHMRKTLDQFYYTTLQDTESRDLDQVVEKYSRKYNWSEHRVLMVDQLWLWVLNNGRESALFLHSPFFSLLSPR